MTSTHSPAARIGLFVGRTLLVGCPAALVAIRLAPHDIRQTVAGLAGLVVVPWWVSVFYAMFGWVPAGAVVREGDDLVGSSLLRRRCLHLPTAHGNTTTLVGRGSSSTIWRLADDRGGRMSIVVGNGKEPPELMAALGAIRGDVDEAARGSGCLLQLLSVLLFFPILGFALALCLP